MLKNITIFLVLAILISGCTESEISPQIPMISDDLDNPSPTVEDTLSTLKAGPFLGNSSSISITPFSQPREGIIFEDNLYAIDETSTYKYDFELNMWSVINTESQGIAVYPFLRRNVSVIRDSKWYLLNQCGVSYFDFETNVWTRVRELTGSDRIYGMIGIYENKTLYILSERNSIIYNFDFTTNEFIEHSSFDESLNFGALENPIVKVGDHYYYLKLIQWNHVEIHKFNPAFTSFELLNEFKTEYLAHGVVYPFEDKIIFGLGGEHATLEGSLTDYVITDKFSYYDTTKNEFYEVGNSFYEGRYQGIPIINKKNYYLLGGATIRDSTLIYTETLDKLDFLE